MIHRLTAAFLSLSLVVLSGCGGNSNSGPDISGPEPQPPSSSDNQLQPPVDADIWAVLQTLRYDDQTLPPMDLSNRVADDPVAALFGQKLFFDTRFSGPLIDQDNDGSPHTLGLAGEAGRVSCAGCHIPHSGFVDTRSLGQQISLASRWVLRRTPTLLEVGFVPLANWDGRRDTLWNQALGVMENHREFNSGRLFVATQVLEHHRQEYEAIFGPLSELEDTQRFPPLEPETVGCKLLPREELECRGMPGDAAEYDGMTDADQKIVTEVAVNIGKALAAYQRQLRCGPGRFDQWLDGDEQALTASEQRGAQLFVTAGCAACHSGPRLTDNRFHNVGLAPGLVAVVFVNTDDKGAAEGLAKALEDPLNARGAFSDGDPGHLPDSLGPELLGAFRTPTLRCVSDRPSFMHTGHIGSLEAVVGFFNRGGDLAGYQGQSVLEPLGLTEHEQQDLVNFLGTLDGPGPDAALLAPP